MILSWPVIGVLCSGTASFMQMRENLKLLLLLDKVQISFSLRINDLLMPRLFRTHLHARHPNALCTGLSGELLHFQALRLRVKTKTKPETLQVKPNARPREGADLVDAFG